MNLALQLILILLTLAILAGVGYIVWDIIVKVQQAASDRLESSSIKVSSTGATVGVKSKSRDRYLSDTQELVYRGWTTGETRGYRSWLWGSNTSTSTTTATPVVENGKEKKKKSDQPLKDSTNGNKTAGLNHTRSAPP